MIRQKLNFFTFQLCERIDGKKSPEPLAYGQIKSFDFKSAEAEIMRQYWYPKNGNSHKVADLWIKLMNVQESLSDLNPGDRYLRVQQGISGDIVRLISLSGDRAHCEIDGQYITIPGADLHPLPCLGKFQPSKKRLHEICEACAEALRNATEEDLGQFTEHP